MWPSGSPFLLSGRVSEEILGDLESCLEGGRDSTALADAGLKSGKGDALVSIDSDLRCVVEVRLSLAFAAAAATSSPPFLLAFVRNCVASSKISRFRFGDSAIAGMSANGLGRK